MWSFIIVGIFALLLTSCFGIGAISVVILGMGISNCFLPEEYIWGDDDDDDDDDAQRSDSDDDDGKELIDVSVNG